MGKSIILSTFILLCSVIIESSILSNIYFLQVVPDIVLICSIYFSLLNGKTYGETTGFISGLLLDFISGVPFGFNCLFRTIIGYISGLFSKTIIISGIFIPMISIGIATILKYFLIILISVFYPTVITHVTSIISYKFLFELIANIILAPFIFKLLSFYNKTLSIVDEKDQIDNV
ncbi:MAG: rod shape-determining protein MreD [Treponema sp.]|jgi:rod shape-determining protein MreD|nr:rod shape-determining protein MreD [Treponema sp.]